MRGEIKDQTKLPYWIVLRLLVLLFNFILIELLILKIDIKQSSGTWEWNCLHVHSLFLLLWCFWSPFQKPLLSICCNQGSTIAAVTRTRIRLINFLWSGQQLQWTPYAIPIIELTRSPMSVVKPFIKKKTILVK